MNTTPSFTRTLRQRWQAADSMLCVGLDPDPARIPAHLGTGPEAIDRFCRDIIAATADTVCAFKPQIAYFAAQGAEDVLAGLIAHIHAEHPGIPVILDAKRGDIGSTARQYGVEAFDRFKADALTLSPFMGFDSIEPYFEWAGRGLILLCRTSNPGGNDLQALSVLPAGNATGTPPGAPSPRQSASGTTPDAQPEKLYEHLARLAAGPWNVSGELGLVVGATFPDGYGLVINSSRAILYAGKGTDFADQARQAAVATRDAIRAARDAARA